MKQITQQQIDSILKIIYQLNISAKSFDELTQFFKDLPLIKVEKPETVTTKK